MYEELLHSAIEISPEAFKLFSLYGLMASSFTFALYGLPILFGVAGDDRERFSKLFRFTISFVAGILSFILIFILFSKTYSFTIPAYLKKSSYIYISVAAFSLICGLFLLKLLPLGVKLFKNRLQKQVTGFPGIVAFFFLGMLFVLTEAGLFPLLFPALIVAKNLFLSPDTQAYGARLLSAFALAQVATVFLIVFLSNYLTNFISKRPLLLEYLKVAAGIFLILLGIDLMILA